jgi:hypothetical protein
MPNGDDEWARRYPLPRERMVPIAALQELRDAAAAFLAAADIEYDLDDPTSPLHATADRLEDVLLRVRREIGD